MGSRILFLPLDDRPPNLLFVKRLAKMGKIPLVLPPRKLLQTRGKPIPFSTLQSWFRQQRANISCAIISLDAWIYGGLVPSRHPHVTQPLALHRLALLPPNRSKVFHRSLWVFASLLRSFPTNGPWRSPRVRKRNLRVLQGAVKMVADGKIQLLLIGVEDSRRGSMAEKERRVLEGMVRRYRLQGRVFIVDGTDELGQLTLARHLLEERKTSMIFQPRFSEPRLAHQIPRYESRTLLQNIVAHGQVLTDFENPKKKIVVPLLVHAHPQPQLDWISDHSTNFSCGSAERDVEWILKQERPVAIADVAYVNGACPTFAVLLAQKIYHRRFYYAAWNTAGNTLGTVLSWSAIDSLVSVSIQVRSAGNLSSRPAGTSPPPPISPSPHLPPPRRPSSVAAGRFSAALPEQLLVFKGNGAHGRFLLERFLDDFLYQSIVRQGLKSAQQPSSAKKQILREARKLFMKSPSFPLNDVRLTFPWGRLFEVEVEAILAT